MSAPTIRIPDLLRHQWPWEDDPARFQLLRYGRRSGKDVAAFSFSVLGRGYGPCAHAPGRCQRALTPLKDHCWVGLADGFDILWIPRDYPQATSIWDQEIKPRFEQDPRCGLNSADHTLTLPTGNRLLLRSPENIRSVAGQGAKVGGAVLNEAAWFDLKKSWQDVIRPLLSDNIGWATIASTTNADWDGNQDETGKRILPSYFNRLCAEVMAGQRSAEWSHHWGDARQNEEIDPAEFDALVAEYDPGSIALRQEVYAELLDGGGSRAFPQWTTKVHSRPWFQVPDEWKTVLGMDWGIRNPSHVTCVRLGPRGEMVATREWTWKDKDAYEAGYDLAQSMLSDPEILARWPEWLVVDSAMNERTGVGGKTILSEFQAGIDDALRTIHAPALHIIPAPKGAGSRAAMYNQMTKMLAWGPGSEDGTVLPSRMPLFQIRRTVEGKLSTPNLASDIATAVKHPTKDEVDKDKTPGHALEGWGYLLSLTNPVADRTPQVIPQDTHPGWVIPGVRRSRDRSPETLKREAELIRQHREQQHPERQGRYGRNPRR